jgi:diguanylate cyclase (GGDEF)-like protein/PAS domain S-box-containing protein
VTTLIDVIGYASTVGFSLIAWWAVLAWLRGRTRGQAYLALALGAMAAAAIVGRVQELVPLTTRPLAAVSVAAFQVSAYGLLLFRGTLIPLSRSARTCAAGALLGSGGFTLLVTAMTGSPRRGTAPSSLQFVSAVVLILTWSVCIAEPIIRIWRVSTHRPGVQRARLRALSAGFAGIVMILLVAIGLGPGSAANSDRAQVGFGLAALALIPLLAIAFAPPQWLRRRWRRGEEAALRHAVQALLFEAPDRGTLADRGLEWALRLVGGDAGLVSDTEGDVLASRGLTDAQVTALLAGARPDRAIPVFLTGVRPPAAIAVPLRSAARTGTLIVLAGPFSPLFGADELGRLEEYASSLSLALERVRLHEALIQSEERFRLLVDGVQDHAQFMLSADGTVTSWNAGAQRLKGYTSEQILGRHFSLFYTAADVSDGVPNRMLAVAAAEGRCEAEGWRVRCDGSRFWAQAVVSALCGEDGALRGFAMMVRDITEQAQAARLRAMQFSVTRTIAEADAVEEAGRRILKVIGESMECAAGTLWLRDTRADMLRPQVSWRAADPLAERCEDIERLTRQHGEGFVGRVWEAQRPLVTVDLAPDLGGSAATSASGLQAGFGLPILAGHSVTGVIGFLAATPPELDGPTLELFGDIGRQIGQFIQRKRAEISLEETVARLAEVAATDPLTGLRNRREFERMLSTIPRRPFAILAIDVDNLKRTNDEFGHEAGDVVLRAIALTLSSLLRGWDLIARIGGDEYAVLLMDVEGPDAAAAGERMRNAIHAISVPFGQARISVGWAAAPGGADPSAIWKRADEELFRAKRAGRDTVFGGNDGGDPRFHHQRSDWAQRVDQALVEHRVGVLYQPIVRLADGAVVGHEALARPTGCGPSDSVEDFFAAAQRIGRIRDVDWLCRRMAIDFAPWPASPGWSLFVNVSALTLMDPVHDVDQMLLLLRAAGAQPEQIVLEITEQEIISDLNRLRLVLAAYREQGFRFAVDDVGEGHSTLELLVAANPEFLKIARSLTMSASHSGSRSAIRAAIAFARSSGTAVLAEGIESDFVAEQMAEMGVLLGQGWWLGRPTSLGSVDEAAHRRTAADLLRAAASA